jgi:hypothetical protein
MWLRCGWTLIGGVVGICGWDVTRDMWVGCGMWCLGCDVGRTLYWTFVEV